MLYNSAIVNVFIDHIPISMAGVGGFLSRDAELKEGFHFLTPYFVIRPVLFLAFPATIRGMAVIAEL